MCAPCLICAVRFFSLAKNLFFSFSLFFFTFLVFDSRTAHLRSRCDCELPSCQEEHTVRLVPKRKTSAGTLLVVLFSTFFRSYDYAQGTNLKLIELPKYSFKAFKAYLQYLYTGNFTSPPPHSDTSCQSCHVVSHLCAFSFFLFFSFPCRSYWW